MAELMSVSRARPNWIFGLAAGAAGGFLGYLAFFWIAKQGFYALLVPPGLLGLAAGYTVRKRSMPFAIVCGVAGLALGLFTEWQFAPFVADDSLLYFLTHLFSKSPFKLLMIALGPVISYRLALGWDERRSTVQDSPNG